MDNDGAGTATIAEAAGGDGSRGPSQLSTVPTTVSCVPVGSWLVTIDETVM
jgi:hypothetical protein